MSINQLNLIEEGLQRIQTALNLDVETVEEIIDLLKGVLWDEEEALEIKEYTIY